METTKVWSPALVEELLFREFIKEENISAHLPPAPKVNDENYLEQYDQATRILFSYVRNGPVTALSSQNVNTTLSSRFLNQHNPASNKGNALGTTSISVSAATPSKGLANRTPQPRTEVKVEAPLEPPTPAATAVATSLNTTNHASASTTVVTHTTAALATAAPNLTRQHTRTPTPLSSQTQQQQSRSTSALKSTAVASTSESTATRSKCTNIEWPSEVPTNAALKSNSRSKVAHLTARRVAAQENIDPDLIFAQNNEELPLHTIFASFPQALSSISAVRKASGDWRSDSFTQEEEQLYKKEMHFTHMGKSQCQYGNWPM